ncbi:hypothetical protein FCR2A7T_05090 [Flavobacterium cauense R2A-7]|nr:hypothetical protein FCR2A7T_05090 [Flavobacterium cauense R2A-7]
MIIKISDANKKLLSDSIQSYQHKLLIGKTLLFNDSAKFINNVKF